MKRGDHKGGDHKGGTSPRPCKCSPKEVLKTRKAAQRPKRWKKQTSDAERR